MPELPEVTTITNQLKKEIVGKKIVRVESVDGYRTTPTLSEFKEKVLGRAVKEVKRIAKTINIELDSGDYLVIHLAMTGRLLLRPVGSRPDPWTRLIFRFGFPQGHPLRDSRGDLKELRFCDARMFGYVVLMNEEEIKSHQDKYGPDPLDSTLTAGEFLERLRLRRTGVKRALLEQDLVAGVGNIYANEGLWEARIHPETPTENIDLESAEKLLTTLRDLLNESIDHRGSTLDDKMYVDLYGREGEHQKYFRIFGKGGRPCPRCSQLIEHKEIGGRQTYFCAHCQVKREPLPDEYRSETIAQTRLL